MTDLPMFLRDYKRDTSGANQPVEPLKLAGDCAPDCPVCGGLGWLRGDYPVDHPMFGKMQICPERLPRVLAIESGLQGKELDYTWEKVKSMNNADDGVKATREVLERGGWVFLWGPPGLAKTLILQIAVAESIRARRAATYVRMVEVIDNLRRSFDTEYGGEEEARRLERWATTPILAIDEFDRVKQTEYAATKRFELMDRRYADAVRGKTITLMSSNANPRTFDDYLSSRIMDGRFAVVNLTGTDVRPLMGW